MLEAVAVTKHFGGVPALRGANFLLDRGQVHGIAGVGRAGKSTLVKTLSGALTPDKGMLFHRGEHVRFARPGDAQAAGISTLYQEDNLVESLSVAANVYLGREPRTRFRLVDTRRMHTDAARLLGSLGVHVDTRTPLRALPPGTRQLVAIARAMETDAGIVVLDEPATALTRPEVELLFEVIRWWHLRGVSVVYASSRVDELHEICDTVTVLRNGRTVHTGPMTELTPVELATAMRGSCGCVCRP